MELINYWSQRFWLFGVLPIEVKEGLLQSGQELLLNFLFDEDIIRCNACLTLIK